MGEFSNSKSPFAFIVKIFLFPFKKGMNKQFLIFLLFVLISSMFWFLQSLDDERDMNVSLQVEYVNVPQGMILVNNPPSTISVKLRDKSLNLLNYMLGREESIKVDLSLYPQDKEKVILSRDELMSTIKKGLKPSTQLMSFYSDSIVLMYAGKEGITVPVKIKSNITVSNNSVQTGDIKVMPSAVKVYSDSSTLLRVKEVESEFLALKNVSDTIVAKVKLKSIYGAKIEPEVVEVLVPVEELISKKITLPIGFVNLPDNISLITFPANAQAEVLIPMSQYANTTDSKFKIDIDYKNSDFRKKRLPLVISKQPEYVRRISINPDSVEYIVNVKRAPIIQEDSLLN